jgi:hypothetical protein
MRFSRTGSPTSFTAGIRFLPPRPVGPRRDDAAVEVDEAVAIQRAVDHRPPPVGPRPPVPFGHEEREPVGREVLITTKWRAEFM